MMCFRLWFSGWFVFIFFVVNKTQISACKIKLFHWSRGGEILGGKKGWVWGRFSFLGPPISIDVFVTIIIINEKTLTLHQRLLGNTSCCQSKFQFDLIIFIFVPHVFLKKVKVQVKVRVVACHCMSLHVIACHCMSLHVIACRCMSLHVIACHCIDQVKVRL